jgi:PAS domain S-box-containing protein
MKRGSSVGAPPAARARRTEPRRTGQRNTGQRADLRRRAEAFLRTAPDELARMPITDVQTLVHELQVHQIELGIQNEELRRAQVELADSRDRYTDLYEFAPMGYLSLDASGRIREANLSASTLLAVERRRLIGKRFSSFVLPQCQDDWYRHFAAVRAAPVKQACELALREKAGEPVWCRLETMASPAKSSPRTAWECRLVMVDVSQRKRMEEELRVLNESLEQRVEARTAELQAANESLGREIRRRGEAESALGESEARLRAIVDTAVDAIITIDARGTIESANPATERMFGYGAGEMIGRNVRMLMPSPYREEHDRYLQRYFETGEARIIGVGRELVARRKDGSTFPVDLAVSAFRDRGLLFAGIVRDISERKNLQWAVAESLVEEQQAIGRELHDGVAQRLSGVEMLTSVLHARLRTESSTDSQALGRILAELRGALEQLRAVIKGVHVFAVKAGGLPGALRELARDTESLHGLPCAFESSGQIVVPDANTATQLYYIAREAVHNAARHARASRITISLEADERRLILAIWDDGRGIEPKQIRAGMGTQIMEYRAGLIGGTLDIRGLPGGGSMVVCLSARRPMAG